MLRWESRREQPDAWVVRVYYKPFVDWIWGGCLVMAIGGVLALSDRRYRFARSTSGTSRSHPVGDGGCIKEVGPCATFAI